jgi:hypothetical protein
VSAADQTTFSFTSNPASRVGRGQSPAFTVQNAGFHVLWDSRMIGIDILPTGATTWVWRFRIQPPAGQAKLTTGTFPIGTGQNGHAVEFAGEGNQCGTPSGTVTIEAISTPGFVEHFRLSYSIQCDGTPAVNGRIVLNWVAGVGYR